MNPGPTDGRGEEEALIELAATRGFARPGDTLEVWLERADLPPEAWVRLRLGNTIGPIPDGRIAVVAPAAPDTIIIIVETGVDSVLAADTLRIVVAEQFVVLKVDDLGLGPAGRLSSEWHVFLDYIEQEQLYAAIGLVARSIETSGPDFLADARAVAASPHFEIWNHGYDHVLGATDSAGQLYSEFRGSSFGHQLEHLRRAQQLALDSLGVVMRTFGAPGNAIDTTTTRALQQVPDLEVWLFGRHDSDLIILERLVEAESRPGHASFDLFIETYDPGFPVITLQIHPASWGNESFLDFRGMVDYLRARGAAFVLPRAYADYVLAIRE